MSGLEDKINNKKVSFNIKDIKWIIGIVITVIGWSVTAYLWIADKNNMSDKIEKLESENNDLTEKVIRLEGQVEGVNNAAKVFMENSPSENRYRIERLEDRVEHLELPGDNPPMVPTSFIPDTNNIMRRNEE